MSEDSELAAYQSIFRLLDFILLLLLQLVSSSIRHSSDAVEYAREYEIVIGGSVCMKALATFCP